MEILDDQQIVELGYLDKPSLILRVKSMIIDSILIIVFMFLASLLLNSLEVESGRIRGTILYLIFLYEPILTSINRTLGQKIMGIRVISYKSYVETGERKNINIFSSLLRYLGKIILGWVSLLTIHSNKYGRAIHDKMGSSVMVKEK